MMVIENKYRLEQIVYLKTDIDQLQRIVTAISARQGSIIYELSCGDKTSSHYDFEMSEEENELIKMK